MQRASLEALQAGFGAADDVVLVCEEVGRNLIQNAFKCNSKRSYFI